jgi:hypothetical protein
MLTQGETVKVVVLCRGDVVTFKRLTGKDTEYVMVRSIRSDSEPSLYQGYFINPNDIFDYFVAGLSLDCEYVRYMPHRRVKNGRT